MSDENASEASRTLLANMGAYARALVRANAALIEAGMTPEDAIVEARYTAMMVIAMKDVPNATFPASPSAKA